MEKNRSSAELLHSSRTDILNTSLAETGHECVQLLVGECKADCRGWVEVAQNDEQDLVADFVDWEGLGLRSRGPHDIDELVECPSEGNIQV